MDIPFYFQGRPIKLTMEFFESSNSIQIDEFLNNSQDIFDLEEL